MVQFDESFRSNVRRFMNNNWRDYTDPRTGEVNMTAIAEAAQREFDVDYEVDVEADEFTFEAAFEIFQWVDQNFKIIEW